MAFELDSLERKSWEGFPIPGTRVRVPRNGDLIEGIVLSSPAPSGDWPHVWVGLWVGGLPEQGLPATYIRLPYACDEVEIISEPGQGLEGWDWPEVEWED